MKASNLGRVQDLLTNLTAVWRLRTRLSDVPAEPASARIFFFYSGLHAEDRAPDFNLAADEAEPIREQVDQLLASREQRILNQLVALGVDADG